MTDIVVPNVGRFEIIEDCEEDYPGVDVEFIPTGAEAIGHTQRVPRERSCPATCAISWPRIVFERPVDGKLRLLVWADSSMENYSHKFEWDI